MFNLIRGLAPVATAALLAVVSLQTVAERSAAAQGDNGGVTSEDVLEMKMFHYYTPDKRAHDADFEWTFTKTDFVIKKAAGDIPADLLAKLLPEGSTATEVRGKWKLDYKDGQQLILSSITAGEEKGLEKASLRIYKTAPTVVRIGEPQYVFGIGP